MAEPHWQESVEQILGASRVRVGQDATGSHLWGGSPPRVTTFPESREQVCELMRFASTERLIAVPYGRGSKLRMGGRGQPADIAISLERLNKVCDYPASDLTISVEPGLPIRELESALAAKRQMLPLDVPFADDATIGGTIAANINGPRRLAYGTWRDIVLGVHYATADGKLAKGGGRVVKNVAGYDIPKLMIGSFGTLGVIVEVTFKVFPQPPGSATIALGFRSAEQAAAAARLIGASQMLPQALDLVDASAAEITGRAELRNAPFTLLAGAAGTEPVLRRFEHDLPALVRAGGLQAFAIYRGPQEANLWKAIQELTPAFLRKHPDGVVIRASLPLTEVGQFLERTRGIAEEYHLASATLARAGSGIVYDHLWGASSKNSNASAAGLTAACGALIGAAEQGGGRAIVEWCPGELKSKINLWGTLGDDFASMRQLKAALDPQGILSPGRFYGGI